MIFLPKNQSDSFSHRILYVIPEDWFFWTHRRTLAKAMREAGFEVVVVTRVSKHRQQIEAEGFRIVPFQLRRSSRNPVAEIHAILELYRIYQRESPLLVHHLTIKPVLYGAVAASLAGVPGVVSSVPGLGHVFVAKGKKAQLLRTLIKSAYWVAFRINGHRSQIIFENQDNCETFVKAKLAKPSQANVIRGLAGATCDELDVENSLPIGTPIVMMAGRLLWSKGVGELVEAGKIVRLRGLSCRVVLVGEPDTDNPSAVPEATLHDWHRQGIIEWWGRRSDMPAVLAQASIVVLPSMYGEGLPKILIEASAVGRPIIASNIPGCRDVVRHCENGLLVPPGDVEALADAIMLLLQYPDARAKMGANGRRIVSEEFTDAQIVAETMSIYRRLVGKHWPKGSL